MPTDQPGLPETWWTTADVEAAQQRLAANFFGGPGDIHDLDRDDIREIIQAVLTATWPAAYQRGLTDGELSGRGAGATYAGNAIAHDIRRELVCCDIYERKADTEDRDEAEAVGEGPHAICFWGEAAARIAERLVGPWEPANQPEPVKVLSYCYGPTSTDPYPGAMWCIDCGGQVSLFDGHAVCGCGAQLCESPADCGDDACPYRPVNPEPRVVTADGGERPAEAAVAGAAGVCDRHPQRWYGNPSPTTGLLPCDGDPSTCTCRPAPKPPADTSWIHTTEGEDGHGQA